MANVDLVLEAPLAIPMVPLDLAARNMGMRYTFRAGLVTQKN